MKTESITDRFDKAIDYLVRINKIDGRHIVQSISDTMGRNPNNVRAAIRGDGRYLTLKFIRSFCTNYGNVISPEWIWTGSGSMERDDDFTPQIIHLPSDSNSRNSLDTKPRIPAVAMAGYLSDYVDGVRREDCEFLPIIQRFPLYDFTIIVKGNSMEPKYEGGDEIACKRVYDVIEWGKTYILDTADGAIIKRIYDAGDKIRCVSYNSQEYPDFFIAKDCVRGFYKVVGLVRI